MSCVCSSDQTLAKGKGLLTSQGSPAFSNPFPLVRSLSPSTVASLYSVSKPRVCSFSLSLHPSSSFVFVPPFLLLRFRLLPLLLLFSLFPPRFLPNGEPFRLTIDGGALYAAVRTLTEGQKSLSPPRVFPLASHIALGPAPALLHRLLNHHHHHHLEQRRKNGSHFRDVIVLGLLHVSGFRLGYVRHAHFL